MFSRLKFNLTALKLYSIAEDQYEIDRSNLVDLVLEYFKNQFGELPKEFVIHGPYGISKGQSVGIKAFRNKLNSKGHEKYYALSGDTELRLGFEASFSDSNESGSFSELIIWFNSQIFEDSLVNIATLFNTCFPVSSGYQIDIDPNKFTVTEHKITKGFFGGFSIHISQEGEQWIQEFEQGGYKKVFSSNLFSQTQMERALKDNPRLKSKMIGHLHYVEVGA
ncbi:hypothetical protein J8L70_10540 [Pseudoalteromonas sp. MMG010]|uniref:hypothetical protein n=1 Tax=Pseudoalteromonas sp. MMG010 TaxID=2822685 RepID=UPI001B3A3232|nr:hypothetical protein [Pseudoalteromonas sp. MMG010]MBQ4833679.1 hypothetical protein [Pseudoalteromonas sp. MMG010]